MFSKNIIMRTSDSHHIYNNAGIRIDMSKNVKIENYVWIAPKFTIMKGDCILDGCVIGSNTNVYKTIPSNTLAVGILARVVKENINWIREKLF